MSDAKGRWKVGDTVWVAAHPAYPGGGVGAVVAVEEGTRVAPDSLDLIPVRWLTVRLPDGYEVCWDEGEFAEAEEAK